jgi:cyclic pyranopterin phosphate synthase
MQNQSEGLTHVNVHGEANMVDVTEKQITQRQAVAEG